MPIIIQQRLILNLGEGLLVQVQGPGAAPSANLFQKYENAIVEADDADVNGAVYSNADDGGDANVDADADDVHPLWSMFN